MNQRLNISSSRHREGGDAGLTPKNKPFSTGFKQSTPD
jgi:hypothetical protein